MPETEPTSRTTYTDERRIEHLHLCEGFVELTQIQVEDVNLQLKVQTFMNLIGMEWNLIGRVTVLEAILHFGWNHLFNWEF